MTATVSIDTEILTRGGWKIPTEILQNDLGLSCKDGYHIWSPMSIDIVSYTGAMTTINCQSLKAELSCDSNVLCQVRKKTGLGELVTLPLKNLRNQIFIPSVSSSNTSCSLDDDQIRLAGWIMTDGGFSARKKTPQFAIYQSKPSNEIERLLKSNSLEFSVDTRERDIRSICGTELKKKPLPQKSFRLSAKSTRQVLKWIPENIKQKLPGWCFDLSNDQFDIFLQALVAGDGSKYRGKECYILYGRYEMLSNIQLLATTHGWRAVISVAREKDFRLNLCKKQGIEFKPSEAIHHSIYNGRVWTAKTKNQNLLVRKNGTAYFIPTYQTS
jgi:hypothetical protein